MGQYRRKQNDKSEVQDASFFDHNNPVRPTLDHRSQLLNERPAGWTHLGPSCMNGAGTPLAMRGPLLAFSGQTCTLRSDLRALLPVTRTCCSNQSRSDLLRLLWQAGIRMRETALHAALDEMIAWLETSTSQVNAALVPLRHRRALARDS